MTDRELQLRNGRCQLAEMAALRIDELLELLLSKTAPAGNASPKNPGALVNKLRGYIARAVGVPPDAQR